MKSRSSRKIQFVGVTLALLVSACGPDRPSAKLTATADATLPLAPVRDDYANLINYIDATDDEVYDAAFLTKFGNPQFLPYQQALTRRMQFWSDELYQKLSVLYPSLFVSPIPRPIIRLMVKDAPNAFVSSALVCYQVPVRFDQQGSTFVDTDNTISFGNNGDIGLYPRAKVACLAQGNQKITPLQVVRYLVNNIKLKGCEVWADGDQLVLGTHCKLGGNQPRISATSIALSVQTNRITMTTGLVSLFNQEEPLLNSLIHELVHYYRAHGTLIKKSYSFFYQLNAANSARGIPAEDRSLRPLGARLQALPQYRTQPITDQRYHSQMFTYYKMVVNKLVQPVCIDDQVLCHEACAPLQNLAQDTSKGSLFGRFPQSPLKDESLALYFRYEQMIAACLSTITVDLSSEGVTAGHIRADEVKKTLWNTDIPSQIPSYGFTLHDAWLAMNAKLLQQEKAQNDLLKQALDARLGYYTTEEEADNLALYWLSLLGINPQVAIDHWFIFAKAGSGNEQESAYNFSVDKCKELYQAIPRWTEGGSEVSVPIGSFAENHHSSCFRIYNIDRRLAHQHYPVATELISKANETTQSSYQDLRREIIAPFHFDGG